MKKQSAPLNQIAPIQQAKPNPLMHPAAQQLQNNQKPSVVAQLGRELGGEAAIEANIRDMFTPKTQQGPSIQPAGTPRPNPANAVESGLGNGPNFGMATKLGRMAAQRAK